MGILYDMQNIPKLVQALSETSDVDYGTEAVSTVIEGLDELMAMDENYMRGVFNSIKYSDISYLSEATNDFVLDAVKCLEQASFQLMQLFSHQIAYLDKTLRKDEKFVNTYGEYILARDVEKLSYTGFWFTVDNGVPNKIPMENFIKEIKDGKKTLTTITTEDVQKYESELSYSDYPNILRGKIAKSKKKNLDLDEYQAELFKSFRDGKSEPMDIMIDKKDIASILERISKTRDTVKLIQQEQEEMRDAYLETMKHLKYCQSTTTGSKPNIFLGKGGARIQFEDYYRYMMLLSRKAQIHFYMYNIAYGEKMVAIRDGHKQDCEILIEFIKRMR